jgi:hypothetical protein
MVISTLLCILIKCEKMVLFELSNGTKGKFRILQKKIKIFTISIGKKSPRNRKNKSK